jgi:hypothetical protein
MKYYQEWKENTITPEQAHEYVKDYTQIIINLKALIRDNSEYLTQREQEEIKGTIKILALYVFNFRR